MKNKTPKELIEIIARNPDSINSKEAQARLNFYYLNKTNKQNKIITIFTVVIAISTVIQAISLILNCT